MPNPESEPTVCSLYKHGTELVCTVTIPAVFPNLPDILEVGGLYYRNVTTGFEEPFQATYWLATFLKVPPAGRGDA